LESVNETDKGEDTELATDLEEEELKEQETEIEDGPP